jgi:hypothetical protein
MADPGVRREHLEVVEGLLGPVQQFEAFVVALELQVGVDPEGVPPVGISRLILSGSPPRAVTASRIATRSTTNRTPVKSCINPRAGVNWISVPGSAPGSQAARARTWSAVTSGPSSLRSRFSSSTLRL